MASGTKVASLFVELGADVSDLTKSFTQVDKQMSGLEKTTNAIGKTFVAAFAVASTAIVSFSAVVAKSVDAAADMEQKVADIRSIFGKTAPAVEELNDAILDLGLDPTLKVSATQAAEAVEMLAKNGLGMSEILNGAARNTVLLANATGDNFALAADIATDVMQQFNISADNMSQAVNGIVGVTQASKFDINDYALAIAQAGGVASSVGVNFDDFNATIAAISPSFGSGSDAGTSFKVFLQRLVPTTDKAKGALIDLGLSTGEDVVTAFFDASGAMRPMEEIAANLHTAFSGLSDAQRNEAASTIFGTDAMRAALALADAGGAVITKYKQQIGDTSAEEAAAMRMDTFRGAMEIAQGIVESLTISVGQKFLPVLRPLVEKFSELAQTYGPMVVDWFGVLAEKIGGMIGGFLGVSDAVTDTTDAIANFGPVLGLTEERSQGIASAFHMVQENFGYIIEAIKVATKPITDVIAKFVSWKDVMWAVGILMTGPLLGAITAIIGALISFLAPIAAVTAAVAALRWAWENDFLGIQTFTKNALERISNWFFKESGIWKGSWEDTFEYIAWWTQWGWKLHIYAPLTMYLQDMKIAFQLWVGQTKAKFVQWVTDVVNAFNDWRNRISDKFGDAKNKVMEIWNDWSGNLVQDVGFQLGLIETRWTVWKNAIISTVRDWKDDIMSRFQGVFDWWDQNISPWVQKGRDWIQGLWDGVKQKWNEFNNWFQGVWRGSVQWVKDLLGIRSPSTVFAEIGVDMMSGLANGIDDASSKVYASLDTLNTGMTDSVKTTLGTLSANVGQTMVGIGAVLNKKVAPFVKLEDALGNDTAGKVFEAARTLASDANQALRKYGISDQGILYYAQKLNQSANFGNANGVGGVKLDIDNLIQQLNNTGVANNFGAQAKTGLTQLSDYLGTLIAGGVYTGDTSWLPAETTTPSDSGNANEMLQAMLDTLKAILEVLRQNGAIDNRGYESILRAMGARGGDYGALVTNTAGLR